MLSSRIGVHRQGIEGRDIVLLELVLQRPGAELEDSGRLRSVSTRAIQGQPDQLLL